MVDERHETVSTQEDGNVVVYQTKIFPGTEYVTVDELNVVSHCHINCRGAFKFYLKSGMCGISGNKVGVSIISEGASPLSGYTYSGLSASGYLIDIIAVGK